MAVIDAATSVEAQRDDGAVAGAVRLPVALPPVVIAAALVVGTGGLVVAVLLGAATVPVTLLAVGLLALGTVRSRSAAGDRLSWTVPPALRLVEYTTVITLAAATGGDTGAAAAFVYVFSASYHHYDTVYRIRHRGEQPPRWLVVALGGWEGRLGVFLLAWAAGASTMGAASIGVWCGVLAVTESIGYWRRSRHAEPQLARIDAEGELE